MITGVRLEVGTIRERSVNSKRAGKGLQTNSTIINKACKK